MGRIWGTIYRIRVEIVIASSEYLRCRYCCDCIVFVHYFLLVVVCSTLHIYYCFAQVIILLNSQSTFLHVYSLVSVAGRPVGGEEE